MCINVNYRRAYNQQWITIRLFSIVSRYIFCNKFPLNRAHRVCCSTHTHTYIVYERRKTLSCEQMRMWIAFIHVSGPLCACNIETECKILFQHCTHCALRFALTCVILCGFVLFCLFTRSMLFSSFFSWNIMKHTLKNALSILTNSWNHLNACTLHWSGLSFNCTKIANSKTNHIKMPFAICSTKKQKSLSSRANRNPFKKNLFSNLFSTYFVHLVALNVKPNIYIFQWRVFFGVWGKNNFDGP